MQCSAPPPLSDDQITTALDGAAEPGVQTHLAQCPACALRLARASRLEDSLREALHRWDCPAPQALADYHIGRMTGEAERAVLRHLAICARCRDEIEELRLFLLAEEPPATAEPAPEPRTPSRPPRRPLVARLPALPAAPALRGGGGPIQATAGDTTIFLDVQPAAGVPAEGRAIQVALQGQLVHADAGYWSGALAELRRGGALLAIAEVDDLGMFACGPVPAGSAELRLLPRGGEMVVFPDLDLAV
jgi:hypothetical protein